MRIWLRKLLCAVSRRLSAAAISEEANHLPPDIRLSSNACKASLNAPMWPLIVSSDAKVEPLSRSSNVLPKLNNSFSRSFDFCVKF